MIQSKKIGLAVDAVGAYGRGIVRGVSSFCRTHPDWLIVEEPQWSFAQRVDLAKWEVDGVIAQVFSEAFEDDIAARGLAAVNVSNLCKPRKVPTVLPDDDAVGEMAANYLISLGLRDFGYIWPGNCDYGRLRLDSFRKHITAAGLNFQECNAHKQDMAKWLLQLPKPAAVMGCNDDWAHRLLKAARRVDISVPDQIAVLGVDDDELINTLITPSLSSIALPAEQIGYEAAVLLDQLIDKKKNPAPPPHIGPLRVVTRKSTEFLFVDDVEVAAAVRFIHDHAGAALRVDDLLDHVPLSRRSLERRFRDALGRSISQEMRRVHIERAKQLLVTTDLSIKQIATASGFENATRMGIVFQKEVGEPPGSFRWRSRMGTRNKVSHPHGIDTMVAEPEPDEA